jgi:hypothetical protein
MLMQQKVTVEISWSTEEIRKGMGQAGQPDLTGQIDQ